MSESEGVPEGFQPLFRSSPFLDLTGPFYFRKDEDGFVVGARVLAKHANARGTVHGGFLSTLCDIALGYRVAFSEEPPVQLITASITVDFAGFASIGDWIEARVDIQKVGTRLAFANCYVYIREKRIARASAVFSRN